MNGSRAITKWARLVITAGLATTLSVAVSQGGSNAALTYDTGGPAGIGDLTRFQIDGDRNPALASNSAVTNGPGVTGDWDGSPYGPQPIGSDNTLPAPLGVGSTGVLPLVFADIKSDDFPTVSPSPNPAFGLPGEPEFCTPNEEDAWVGGTKFTDISIDNPLYDIDGNQALQCAQVLGKGDLFSVYAAYETVAVPNVYGDPDSGSQNHVIVYGAWERGEVPGELNFYIPIADEIPGNSANDLLIAFDYNSSADASFRILKWDGTTWYIDQSGTAAVNGEIFAAAVGFADGSPFTASNQPSFGEFALDITAAGVLPETSDGACIELATAGYVFTETGNSSNAQLKDFVGAPRIPIGNCGSLSVTKAGPAAAGSLLFDYRIEQQDSLDILPSPPPATTPASLVNQINSQFSIGQTETWTGLFAEPDYVAFENPLAISGAPPAALPAGWEMVSVDCTYIDGFQAPYAEVTTRLYENGARTVDANGDLTTVQVHSDAFHLLAGFPGYVPECTITNDTAGVIIEKAGLGDLTQDFTFDANGEPATLQLGGSAFIPFAPGTSVTITEADPGTTPGWSLDSIVCTDSSGPVGSVDLANRSVTITTNDSEDKTTCVFTNNQAGRLVVEKVGAPDGGSFDFEHDVDGDTGGPADFSLAIPSVVGAGAFETGDIAPGTYTITELLAGVNTGVDPDVIGSAVCSGEAPVAATTGDVVATVTVDPGETVTCTFSNTQNGTVIIEKVINGAVGAAAEHDFSFATSGLTPAGFDLDDDAGDATLVDTQTISNVEPGGDYTVTEAVPAGWELTSLVCDDGASATPSIVDVGSATVDVNVEPGEIVHCTFTNTAIPSDVEITKTVEGNVLGGVSWSFDFTISPLPGGSSPQAAAGTGSSSATVGWSGLTPGATYTVTEVAPTEGFEAGTLSCTGVDDLDLVADQSVTFVAPLGGDGVEINCAITNTQLDADLAIVKTASVAQVGAGNSFTFDLDVTNNGPGPAVDVIVDDLVPDSVTVTGVSSSFFDCGRSGNLVSCTRPSMAVGASGSITITVLVPADSAAATVVNVGTVEAETPDPDLSNNSDDASVVVVAQIPPATTTPTLILPPTGSDATTPMVQLGLALLLLGVAGVALTRRRHEHVA